MKTIIYFSKIIVRSILKLLHENKEEILSFGENNKDKIFYLICPDADGVGLFSYFTIFTGHIRYARKKGYIPVIDMMNYRNTYLDEKSIGKENAWEYYFKQPDKYSLSEVYESKNVIKSSGAPIVWPDASTGFCFNKKIRNYWKKIVRENIFITDEILNEANDKWNSLFNENDRVLGVNCRGTDYIALRPKWHPKQPEPQKVIAKVKEVMSEQKCTKIFLATEDKDIYKMFKEKFGEIVVDNDVYRYDYDGKSYIAMMKSDREDDKKLRGKEYLITTLLLSKCNCFIGGRNGGAVGALLFADNYEYEYIWNLGRYL